MLYASFSYADSLRRLLTRESTPKLGLARIAALLRVLGNPEQQFRAIHIAGTNGKGSTSAFTKGLLRQNFDRVGLFTSPHLLCARERIQINNELISEEAFCEATKVVLDAAERANEQPTFFELTTAMAFWLFAKHKVDIAVIEVGLGGRLDSTNVITPLASVITRIDMDHCDFLGDTIEKIASEKAGIIKPAIPIVTGFQCDAAIRVIQEAAVQQRAPLIEVTSPCSFELGLVGKHQMHNAALAMAAVEAAGVKISEDKARKALASTRWPARLEFVSEDPPVLVDGAHNPAGMKALNDFLAPRREPVVFVLGATVGHDATQMIHELIPLQSKIQMIFATQSRSPRAADAGVIAGAAKQFMLPSEVKPNVQSAVEAALRYSSGNGALTIVAGSLYVAGEARSLFFEMPIDPELPHY